MKNFIWIVVLIFSIHAYTQEYKTILVSAKSSSDGTRITMIFNNSIISGSNIGLSIYNTTDTSFNSISGIGTKTLVGTLRNPIVYGEPVNISYKSIETLDNVSGDLQDINGSVRYFLKEIVDVSAISFSGIEKYVTVTGGGSHDGLSEANAYNLKEMVSNLAGGIRMNVKAGDYGSAEIVINKGGYIGNPLIIEGYAKIAGDNPDTKWDYDSNRKMDGSKMPIFDGGYISGKKALVVKRVDYITIKNIQILNYGKSEFNNGYGVYVNISNNIWLDNIIVENTNRCIVFSSCNNSVLTNSIGLNGWLSNISIYGNNNLFYKNRSYSNLTTTYDEGTDYYYSLTGNNNVFRGNYAKRDGDIGHAGHGLSIDANGTETAYYNFIDNHTTVNIDRVIEYRHPNVVYNVAKGLHSYGEGAGSDKTGGITIRDNAHDNIIDGGLINLHNVSFGEGILFMDSAEEGIGIGSNNIIKNVVFNGGRFAIISNDTQKASATGTGNKILNCTFKDYLFMFRTYGGASMSSCEINNSIIENTASINWENNDNKGWKFDYCNFNNGFTEQGSNSIILDPKLDINFSSTIAGLKAPRLKVVPFDKNGIVRKDPTTIGAIEYQDTTTGYINANAGPNQSICFGESITLTASGGSVYSWSTGATTKSITVSPDTTTVYTVTVSEGSASDSDAVTVAVSSVTAGAGGNKTITSGESVTLTASGGDSYVWNTGATTKSITVTPTATITYTVTGKTRRL